MAIQSTLDTELLGSRTSAVRFTAASAAIRSASLTLPSTSLRATTTLGLCIRTMPRMPAYTACRTGTSERDGPDSAPMPRSNTLNRRSLHTTLGHLSTAAASSQGQCPPPDTTR